MAWGFYGWRPYVPVAERRRRAAREAARLKKGEDLKPISVQGRKIASTFWGRAWCENLESYSDYENRLPRGRTYLRNGSVLHLDIAPGEVSGFVAGQDLYKVAIGMKPVEKKRWNALARECTGKIGSVLELLEGRISQSVLQVIARRGGGLFPEPGEMEFACSCPDWAVMCKHVSAVLYGVGRRLDDEPELLFRLRRADPSDLITRAGDGALGRLAPRAASRVLETDDLSGVFGIDLESGGEAAGRKKRSRPARGREKPTKRPRRGHPPARANGKSEVRWEPGEAVTAEDLIARGVPRTTFQNWFYSGVLRRTRRRGVYEVTELTEERIETVLRRARRVSPQPPAGKRRRKPSAERKRKASASPASRRRGRPSRRGNGAARRRAVKRR